LERDLQTTLGTKVSLNRTAKGGRLTIHFFSDEELDGIIQRLKR
jgi:ParB family transcriptional regulator, chromosome partitioning protein